MDSGSAEGYANANSDKNFKKWSRNLSADRQRELNRLNQIERRRQVLELRRQNDLFDQMSFTTNDTKTIGGDNLISSSRANDSKHMKDTNRCQITQDNVTPANKLHDQQADKNELGRSEPPGEARAQTELPFGTDKRHDANNGSDSERPASPSKQMPESKLDGNEALGEIMITPSTNEGANSNPHHVQPNDRKLHARDSINISPEQASNINAQQLIEFVSTCVPKNKRVLCLIVRDKVSKFNQAKSYFYPTYYMFIQAIVDIDDIYTIDHMANLTSCEDLTISGRRGSADNSFSASSSISADMMFFGSETASTALLSNETNKAAANSYSDNEMGFDTENEFESERLPTQTPEMNERQAKFLDGYKMAKEDIPVHPTTNSFATADKKNSIPESLKTHLASTISGYDTIEDEDEDDSENEDGYYNDGNQTKMRTGVVYGAEGEDFKPIGNDLDANIITSLFDNDLNPYTGTFGVLLAGRKRKKAKT